MLVQGLKYPLTIQDDALWRKLLIGSILLITSPLVIPALIYVGYIYKLIESIDNNAEKLPEFTNIKELLKHGTKIIILFLIYTGLLAGTVWVILSVNGITQILLSVVSGAFYLLILHLTPLMIYTYVTTDSLTKTFGIKTLLHKSMTRKYTYITVLMSFIYPIVFGIIQGLTSLTLIGIIFIPGIIVWQTISQAYLIAQIKTS